MKSASTLGGGHVALLQHMIKLPARISQYQHLDHLPQVVLHYLGHRECFNFKKAAYFADNPDFDCLLGAAGYCDHDCHYETAEDIWKDPRVYFQHADVDGFHHKIKEIVRRSIRHKDVDLKDAGDVRELIKNVGIDNPKIISWDLKYGNNGLLMYESETALGEEEQSLLSSVVSFLNFCPL